jgi:starch synthase
MNIVHISAECFPVAKVGGLADVVGALPKYQNSKESKSCVIMPLYDNDFTKKNKFETLFESTANLGDSVFEYKVLKSKSKALEFDVFFIDIPDYLFKEYVYSDNDFERFLTFQIASLQWILTWDNKPTIFHCHDHHTGLIPFMLQESYAFESLNKIPVVFTIHNAQYQGWTSHEKVNLIPAFDSSHFGYLDWDNQINPLAAGIKCAWKVTTVSPSYMDELLSNANGLEMLFEYEKGKCVGILNGIDAKVWDTETDTYLEKKFSIKTLKSGKNANKKWLCKTYNLDFSKPLFVFIGRFVFEKGSDLLAEVIDEILIDQKANFLVLGSGSSETEYKLQELKSKWESSYNTYIGYNEKLAHICYAGADFLLMPSRVEPCGLNQMYALRYGTIPVVSAVGGLKDTIVDIENDGFGFVHQNINPDEILHSIVRATSFYDDKKSFDKTRTKIMKIDNSWEVSALNYNNIYQQLT